MIPKNSFFEVVFVYEDKTNYVKIKPNNQVMAIDLGLNNLATCVTNGVVRPFMINGKPLKSINQYYNKKASNIKSGLMKRNAKHWSAKLDTLNACRARKINDYLHKASAKVVKQCLENQISTVIIGDVANSNYKINLGKKTNQNFVNISLGQFIEKLKYNLERHHIKVVVREESYTSKGSFIDNDILPKKYEEAKSYRFSGKRVKRGLYVSKFGKKINADVNGAYNLLRKETPEFSYASLHNSNGVEGWLIPHKLVV
ncbi:MAG: IS200/IS605 family element transposase accessory protein TnpB [Bacteroidia bacterium]|nr:IS200/IS605 family element transposase accessory protein TnpB [Bacteroidia bacterium]